MRDRPASHPGRRPELDGLRGLAALAVLLFHVRLYTRDRPAATALADGAGFVFSQFRLGLVPFFVLSGYLLYGPWVQAALEGGEAPRLARYVTRRASRVLPAYYLALAGSVVLLWGAAGTPGLRLPESGELRRPARARGRAAAVARLRGRELAARRASGARARAASEPLAPAQAALVADRLSRT